jgi:hypothetical protein
MAELIAFDGIYRITSSERNNLHFGTGFACYADAKNRYLLTSAQVVIDVGGPEHIYIDGEQPAVVVTGSSYDRDMAVLRLSPRTDRAVLPLAPAAIAPAAGATVQIPGYEALSEHRCLRSRVPARLGHEVAIEAIAGRTAIQAWRLQIAAEAAHLHMGFRGAPVIDEASGYVIGMVNHHAGDTESLVINIAELRPLWPVAPTGLWQMPPLQQQSTPTAGNGSVADLSSETLARIAQELEQQARELTPPDAHAQLEQLTLLLLATVSRMSPRGSQPYLGILPAQDEILHLLAGKTLQTSQGTVAFGSGNEYGDISVGDVAGGNIIKIYLAPEPAEQPNPDHLTPPKTPLATPVQVYLSSEGLTEPPIQALRRMLALRGFDTWPDEQGTVILPAQQQRRLATSGAAVLHLTEDRLEDDYLADEVHLLRQRFDHDEAFPIGTLLERIDERAASRAGLRLRDFCRFIQPYTADNAATVARKLLEEMVTAYPDRFITEQTANVSLFTFPISGDGARVALLLDWQPWFDPFPGETEWRNDLLPALNDLRQVLGAASVKAIKFSAKARLSAVMAFGYVFREPTGINLWINQGDEWWPTRSYAEQSGPATVNSEELAPDARDITIEISVNADVSNDVAAYLTDRQLPIARRVKVQVPIGMQLNATLAHALACQVREAIRVHKPVNGTTHLFGAMPSGLATLIGWQLNAREPVQCYELERGTGYLPACRLV